MSEKKKIILSIIFIILFIISAIIIVFYSQGLRFDFKKWKITQTGAFYFKVLPSNSRIYIDNEFIKKTDFYVNSAYIGNLLSGKYDVSIKKDNYFPWEKNLEIEENGLVTEAKNITLIKENPNFNLLFTKIEKFFFLPNGTRIILLAQEKEYWKLEIYNLKTNIKNHLISSEDISKEKTNFVDLKISPDSNSCLITTFNPKKNIFSWHLIDLNIIPVEINSLDLAKEKIEQIHFYPRDNNKILFLEKNVISSTNNQLSLYDFEKKKKAISPIENIISFTLQDSNIYSLDQDGYLIKTDINYEKQEKLNEAGFAIKNNTDYEISLVNEFIFIKGENILYLLDPDEKCFKEFALDNKDIIISTDREKAAFLKKNEISIFFMKEQTSQPHKDYKERMFLTRFSEPINNLYWITPHYLIFNSGNKIKISEIDDRDKINIIDLAEYQEPEIYFNQYNKKIYILSENSLVESESII